MYEISQATLQDIEYVWNNIRRQDIRELNLQEINETNFRNFLNIRELYVGKYDNEPVVIFGFHFTTACIWVILFSTNKIYQHMEYINTKCLAFLRGLSLEYIDYQIFVEIWSKYKRNINWLINLGFEETKYKVKRQDEMFIIMEWKG